MELCERQRAGSWSDSKMAKAKTDKDKQQWQAAMEGLKKHMLEGIQEICDKMADE